MQLHAAIYGQGAAAAVQGGGKIKKVTEDCQEGHSSPVATRQGMGSETRKTRQAATRHIKGRTKVYLKSAHKNLPRIKVQTD